MSFKEYVRENFEAWLEETKEQLYESTALDGLLLAMAIWAIILYALGFRASDLIVTGIGGAGLFVVIFAMIILQAVKGFQEWKKERP